MKYLLMFILGFISHKVVHYTYDYSFEKAFTSPKCEDQYLLNTKDPKIDAPLTKRFQCTYGEMGIIDNLKYLLIRPSALDGENWTF